MLKHWCKMHNTTLSKLADLLGVTYRTINKYNTSDELPQHIRIALFALSLDLLAEKPFLVHNYRPEKGTAHQHIADLVVKDVREAGLK